MTCDEARESFSDLYDGHLTGAALADLDRHLEGCPACRAEWDAFLGAIQMVAELGTAEPSPGFAARVREEIEAPTWWQRVLRAMFFPLQVKIPLQAVAVAVVAFAGVMLYQKSPEVMQAQRSVTSTDSFTARREEPASRAGELSAPSVPPASPGPPVGSVLEDRRDVPGQGGAGRLPASPEGQAAPADQPARSTNVAPESDRADAVTGKLDAAKPPAKKPAPPRQEEQQESQTFQYATRERGVATAPPPAAGAPSSPPASEVARRRAQGPLREKAKEQEEALGKQVVPAETDGGKKAETRDEFRGYMESESKDTDQKVQKSAPAPSGAGRALAPAPTAPPPPAATAPEPPVVLQRRPAPEAPGQAGSGLAVVPRGSPDDLYSAGLTDYARQAYDRSAETFRAFLAQYPQDARAPDARYWLADSYFQQQRYAEAIPEYEVVIRQFPESRRAPVALFRQGQARLALGDQAGCQNFRDVVSHFPRTREAGQARETLTARCPNEAR